MTRSPCEIIASGLGGLFTCESAGDLTRIRTPFLYPDGDVIDLFLKKGDGGFTVSDMGETLGWLRMQGTTARRSPKQDRMIEDIRLTHGLELFRGMLMARVAPGESLAPVVMRVAQGALRVADIWFTMRTRSMTSFTDEVEEFLAEKHVTFERSPKLLGRSGLVYRPDFHTRWRNRSAVVHTLSTGSRATARKSTEHVLTSLYDLNHRTTGPEPLSFVSLIDDTMDVWNGEEYQLLGELSTVVLWSRPEEFAEALGG